MECQLTTLAPSVAVQSLQILRDLYFISSRLGANAFAQYTFVYLAALDILAQYPVQAEAFLRDVRPAEAGRIPLHPLDRCLDLYFLNTAEHFTLVLTTQVNEELLIAAATPYLGVGGDQRLLEIFEAAHSTMLAVLAAPQNSDLVAKYIYTYVDVLFKVGSQICLWYYQYHVLMMPGTGLPTESFLPAVSDGYQDPDSHHIAALSYISKPATFAIYCSRTCSSTRRICVAGTLTSDFPNARTSRQCK